MKVILFLITVFILVAIPCVENYLGANLKESRKLARLLQFEESDLITRNHDRKLDDICKWSTVRFSENGNVVELKIPTKTPWMPSSNSKNITDISERLDTLGFGEYLTSNFEGFTFNSAKYQNDSWVMVGSKIIQATRILP